MEAVAGNAVRWATRVAALEAQDFRIKTGAKQFLAQHEVKVRSTGGTQGKRPGIARYSTLELAWREQEVEMRLNLYFSANETHWWVDEIRTYDGHDPAQWIYYTGPFFKARREEPFTGAVTLIGDLLNETPGTIRFGNLTLVTHFKDDAPIR